ncbi:MAG: NAD+ synthase [Candidatus Bathyarchaeota archaeon]|nr:NAD+ synthase [Candidatus Bathyarchaeota archaeon]MDW8039966.1 NAD+ synthase [Nitrososphaerota archaeon]
MKLTRKALDLNWEEVKTKIVRFIKDYVEKAGAKGIVIGLSGGVDSSTAAALSAMAVGGNKVLGLILPEKETYNIGDMRHAEMVAKKFEIKKETVNITPVLEALHKTIPVFDPEDKLCNGNLKARTRMLYLYYYANKFNLIVCGSSDKSETMIGYFTKWGDIAADIAPLMDLYKTQVRELARYIGIPNEIVDKPPTPMLWPGQTAEEEIGIKYEILDLILYGLEHFMSNEEIAEQLGLEKELVEKVEKRWKMMEHKRRMPLTTKIQYRTVGFDFRLPYTQL